MNKLNAVIVLSFLCLVGKESYAQASMPVNDSSTAALVEVCQNASDQDAQNFCFGFGEGVYQAFLVNQSAKVKPSICFTQTGDSREVILQNFLRWNQANPQFNQERAAKTLVRFFAQSYPCN